MSIHTPVSPKHTAADGRQTIADAAMRIAAIMTESNERLFRLQSEAAKAAFESNSKQIKALLNDAGSPAALMQWPSLYQQNAQQMVDVTRSWFESVSQTQAELTKLRAEPVASKDVEAQNYLDQFTKSIADAHTAAAAQVKDFLALAFGHPSEAR
jgi:phasin family protein